MEIRCRIVWHDLRQKGLPGLLVEFVLSSWLATRREMQDTAYSIGIRFIQSQKAGSRMPAGRIQVLRLYCSVAKTRTGSFYNDGSPRKYCVFFPVGCSRNTIRHHTCTIHQSCFREAPISTFRRLVHVSLEDFASSKVVGSSAGCSLSNVKMPHSFGR